VTTDHAALGRPIGGPSALAGDVRRFAHLTVTLAVQEFKLRFFGSALGYLWQLMRPLMLFGVLYVLFAVILNVGGNAKYFPVVLLLNVVVYTFFAEVTTASVRAVVDKENLVRKIRFPRLVIPCSVVLTGCFNLGLNLIVVLIFALLYGVPPRWEWLLAPPMVFLGAILALGCAMLLSALFVRARDIAPIWEVLLQLAFYGSPILYPIEALNNYPIPQQIVACNPLAALLIEIRHVVIDPTAPDLYTVFGGVWWRVLIPVTLATATCVVGYWYFNREAPRIAENL
jgi:ABC-2 type transport system permease protein